MSDLGQADGYASPKIRLILIRHGETDDNARGIIQGQKDTLLNDNGILQAKITRDYLKKNGTVIDVCFSSPLQRARKTAEIIMEAYPGVSLINDDRIKERYFGLVEGTAYYTASAAARATMEPAEVFHGRLLSFFDALFPPKRQTQSIYPDVHTRDINILCVTHGAAIKTWLQLLLHHRRIAWQIESVSEAQMSILRIHNCSLSEVGLSWGKHDAQPSASWQGCITRYGDDRHFELARVEVKDNTEADSAASQNAE